MEMMMWVNGNDDVGDFLHSACGRTANRKYKQYPVGISSVVELIGVLLCGGGGNSFSAIITGASYGGSPELCLLLICCNPTNLLSHCLFRRLR